MGKKMRLEANDACMMMHTALRKLCDSKPTTAAYNLIHIISDLQEVPLEECPWRFYGRLVAERIERNTRMHSPKVVAAILKAANDDLRDEYWKRVEKPRKEEDLKTSDKARTAMFTLGSIFALFDDKDWDGMGGYLLDE